MTSPFSQPIPPSEFIDRDDSIKQWHGVDVNITKLDSFIDEAVRKACSASATPTNQKNEIIMLSGGSASNVGAAVEAMKIGKIIDQDRSLVLDSETIIDSHIIPDFLHIAGKGYKHPEKFTPNLQAAYRQLLYTITERFMDRLQAAGIKGTVVIDDHFEEVSLPQAIAELGKKKYQAEVGYMCVSKDPRMAMDAAATRAASGKGVVAPEFLLGTHRIQPRNWNVLSVDSNIDVALLLCLSRPYAKLPHVAAQRIGSGKPVEILDPLEEFYFQQNQNIPASARTIAEVFPEGKDPEDLFQQPLNSGIAKRGGEFITATIHDLFNGAQTPGFVNRVTRNAKSPTESHSI